MNKFEKRYYLEEKRERREDYRGKWIKLLELRDLRQMVVENAEIHGRIGEDLHNLNEQASELCLGEVNEK